MNRKWVWSIAAIALIAITAVMLGPIMSHVETPKYQVLQSNRNIEIRQYDRLLTASVSVEGTREQAMGEGFRLLADYIFGNNREQNTIAMTAPVQQKKQKIAMTSPVQQQSVEKVWYISFVMPAKYNLDTLPKPLNKRVNITQEPAQQFVVITFSGAHSNQNLKKHEQQLIEYVRINDLEIRGRPKYAFYNPPWTLPMMRRNEIMLEIHE